VTLAQGSATLSSTAQNSETFIKHVTQLYGDLLFDFCESVLWSSNTAQIAFRAILKQVKKSCLSCKYSEFERAWIMRIACKKLISMAQQHGRRLAPSEQIMLDATLDTEARLRHFDSYFHRLPTEDQILLLLRDKYGLPYSEIASALNISEGSLKMRRQQSLRTLEEWLWER
jgi:RNA polymerase sigma factor (sigma-70 family)